MKTIAVSLFVSTLLGSASYAYAGGFLADTFVKPISPHAAKQLDDANKALGNPIDHGANVAAGVIVDSIAPGAGAAVTGGLEARRFAK